MKYGIKKLISLVLISSISMGFTSECMQSEDSEESPLRLQDFPTEIKGLILEKAFESSFGGSFEPLTQIATGEAIVYAKISPTRKTVLMGVGPGKTILRDINTGNIQQEFIATHKTPIISAAFSPDGESILTGSADNAAILWDIKTGDLLHQLSVKRNIYFVAFSSDDAFIITGSGDSDQGSVDLWDRKTGKQLRKFVDPTQSLDTVSSGAMSPDGSSIAVGFYDGHIRLWDIRTGNLLQDFISSDTVGHLAFSPDSQSLLSVVRGKTITLWDVKAEKPSKELRGHSDRISSVAFSSDGRYIFTGTHNGSIILWDKETGSLLRNFQSPTDASILDIAVSPDDESIITVSNDGMIILWGSSSQHLTKGLTAETTEAAKELFTRLYPVLGKGSAPASDTKE